MNKLFSTLKTFALAVTMLCTTTAMAQDREFIRQHIEQWGGCNNVALTQECGSVALYGQNTFAQTGCPQSFVNSLNKLSKQGHYLNDVHISESGEWVILYDNNGFDWSDGIPASLAETAIKLNEQGETVRSVSFNDAGQWIIITGNYVASSDNEIQSWINEGANAYGAVWAACVSDETIVVIYEGGYQVTGNIPESLSEALDQTELNIFRLKISGDEWFLADPDGNYQYQM